MDRINVYYVPQNKKRKHKFKDMENENDYWTVEAMEKYGGSFVKILATMARRADPTNLAKIKYTWSNYWYEYQAIGRDMRKEEEEKQHGTD